MAPENKGFIHQIKELRGLEYELRNKEEESEKIGEVLGMGGNIEETGYKWSIQKEFENNLIRSLSEYVAPEPFFKRITTGGCGYKVSNRRELDWGVAAAMENSIEVKLQSIQKEFFEILDAGTKEEGSMLLVQMLSMKEKGLEKILGYKFEKLLSEYPEYFEIQDLSEYSGANDKYTKFSFLMNMPQKEQNSFLKDADSVYYFLIFSEINKKSHPALRATLETLIDLEERKELLRNKETREVVKKVLYKYRADIDKYKDEDVE